MYVLMNTGQGPLLAFPSAVQCDIPEDPENGKSTFTRRIYNSVVSYKCEYSYMLVGPETRRCGPDKKWSGVQPQCKRRSLVSSRFRYHVPLRCTALGALL